MNSTYIDSSAFLARRRYNKAHAAYWQKRRKAQQLRREERMRVAARLAKLGAKVEDKSGADDDGSLDFLDPEPTRSTAEPIAFLWDNGNILEGLVEALDFCDSSPELKKWYGDKFPLRRNPLMLCVGINFLAPVSVRCALFCHTCKPTLSLCDFDLQI